MNCVDRKLLIRPPAKVSFPLLFPYHLLAEVVPPLLGDVDCRLAVVVLDGGAGTAPEQQAHALCLVLDDAVVQRRVALARLTVQRRRILHQEVHHVQRVAVLVRDGVVQRGLREFLRGGGERVEQSGIEGTLTTVKIR